MSLGDVMKAVWNYNPMVIGAKALGNMAQGKIPTFWNSTQNNSGWDIANNLGTKLGELDLARSMPTAMMQYELDIDRMNAQHDLARSDYDYQMQMESPAMQMQRAKEAGINPIMYAGGVSGTNASIASPQISSGNDFNKSFMDDANKLMSIFGAFSQITKTMQDMELGAEEIEGKKLENGLQAITNRFAEAKNLRELALLGAEFTGKNWDNRLKGLDYNLFNDTYNYRKDQFKYDTEAAELEVQNRNLNLVKLFEELSEFLQTRNTRIESLNLQNDKDRALLREFEDKHKMAPDQWQSVILGNQKLVSDMSILEQQYTKLLNDNQYFNEHKYYPGTRAANPWQLGFDAMDKVNNSFSPISIYKDLNTLIRMKLEDTYKKGLKKVLSN